jgi:DNA-binding PadR family transcriptional regulator
METAVRPETFLPLTAAVFHILLALADGELHGYGIAQKIASVDKRLPMGPGTLYGSIKRMLDDGLIKAAPEPDSTAGNERRRYYQLTQLGWDVARLESQRLWELIKAAERAQLIGPYALAPAPG